MMSICKAAFRLIYILIVYILLVNKIIYKWPYLSRVYTYLYINGLHINIYINLYI